MTKRNVEDYLQDGIYGVRRPKEAEREMYLGTLRERIVLALTIGQVMTDSGIDALDKAMKAHPDTKLLINGQVSHRFLDREKAVARKHSIPYTIVSNEGIETKIGAVLTYPHAVHIKDIFIEEEEEQQAEEERTKRERSSLFTRVRKWFNEE